MPDSSALQKNLIKRQQCPSWEVISSFPFEVTEKYLSRVAKILQEGITWKKKIEKRKRRKEISCRLGAAALPFWHFIRHKFDSNRSPRDMLWAELQVKAYCWAAWEALCPGLGILSRACLQHFWYTSSYPVLTHRGLQLPVYPLRDACFNPRPWLPLRSRPDSK